MTEPVVGVVCALRSEARHLGRSVPRAGAVQALKPGLLRIVSGMGPDAASQAATALIRQGATALASFGMAGALDPHLRPGDIVLPELIRGEMAATFRTDERWHGTAVNAFASARISSEGSLVSVAAPVTGRQAKAALRNSSGARAVDMESLAIARIAAAQALPFLAVRVIIDAADVELPASATAATPGGQVSVVGVLAGLIRRPADLKGLLRLARAFRQANQGLAVAAASGALDYPA
ncbi:MAG: phosphorylase [Proteobacteria bacterium]|nr:phosphorylase [Pseudomonadota bacterium]